MKIRIDDIIVGRNFRDSIEIDDLKESIEMVVVGIDPGLRGALIGLDAGGKALFRTCMPTIGNVVDLTHVALLLCDAVKESNGPLVVFLEEVHARPGMSLKSITTFLRGFGGVEGVVVALGIPLTLVRPQIWQRPFHAGLSNLVTDSKASASKQAKMKSLIAAKRLYPGEPLVPDTEPNKAKVHDGVVDALLIATYGVLKIANSTIRLWDIDLHKRTSI